MRLEDEIALDGERFRLLLAPIDDRASLAQAWERLSKRPGMTAFLSWPWMEAFLEGLPPGFTPHQLELRRGEALIALALLVERDGRWALNESGDAAIDAPTLEYNGFLPASEAPSALARWVIRHLCDRLPGAQSLNLGGLAEGQAEAMRVAAEEARWLVRPLQNQETHWLDLEPFGGDPARFRAALGRTTRQAVQRAHKLYREQGTLSWETAGTADEARAIFAELERLHTAQWQARGENGAFAQASFRPFHERLIATGFPQGLIRLHRLRLDDRTLGCLYNLAFQGTIYAYQSGFLFDEDPRRKPGYLAHAFAIEQAISEGARRYDFCAGTTQLKRSFSSHSEPMRWLELRPPTMRNRLIAWARGAKKGLRSLGIG